MHTDKNTGANILEFPPFTCDIPECCESLDYFVSTKADSYAAADLHPDFTLSSESGNITFTIDFEVYDIYTVYIHARNTFGGSSVNSVEVNVRVDFDCNVDIF